ncbi:MAG: (Fe-S)-binding protein [Deltaproteobacteria bacterium]|nr:MAG: (Fe-S)-binding protein [Deltaproteobacteria bacterium]
MTSFMKNYGRIISLAFPPVVSGKPVICNLATRFDLTFNILKARINPRHEGHMVLELSGKEADYKKGITYLQEHDIKVTPVAQQISRNEESCLHCGVCTALCGTHALYLDAVTRRVEFNRDKCTACGQCTRICPVHAMNVEVEEHGL